MNHSRHISELLVRAAQAKVAELTEQLVIHVGRVVQAGPFKGMKLPEAASWSESDTCAKILGTYEQELHVSIETCIAREPSVLVNIGYAEGYYAVGLAMRLPELWVYAYDSNPKAMPVCEGAARINSVDNLQTITDAPDAIRDLRGMNSLYVIDCEGAELDYVENPAHFKRADLIIECHDFMDATITSKLTERLSATHNISYVREGPRDPSGIELLQGLNTLERYAAICEFRPGVMHWLVALAKSRS